MTLDEAIRHLRSEPRYAVLVRDAYLGPDVLDSAERFRASEEFAEVRRLLQGRLDGGAVLDLGAGTGIASYAFARSGARTVYALEPDPSDVVGRGAIARLSAGLPIEVLDALGESIPLPDGAVDVVYARQVLHHIRELPQALRECARVLRPGGLFLACREHVVKGPRALRHFLKSHPVHRLAGGENAYQLSEYLGAIEGAGLAVEGVYKPLDSIINAFPIFRTPDDLREFRTRAVLERQFGRLGVIASYLPGVAWYLRRRLGENAPGALFTFLARKSP
jgi:SAM-dependent methyltransferase